MTQSLIINCGSAQDQFFAGGYPYSIVNPPAGLPPTYRFSDRGAGAGFSYKIPVEDAGPYVVGLVFVETAVNGPGQRVFGVRLNEYAAIDRIDPFAAAGALKAVYRSFLLYPAEGALNLQFSTLLRAAVVSQITITPFAQYVIPQDPERVQVTGATPNMWSPQGYIIPRPAQVTDPTIPLVFQNVTVYLDGARRKSPDDYSVGVSPELNPLILPVSGQPWPGTPVILVDYLAILPLRAPLAE
jgi:hypothetical protein